MNVVGFFRLQGNLHFELISFQVWLLIMVQSLNWEIYEMVKINRVHDYSGICVERHIFSGFSFRGIFPFFSWLNFRFWLRTIGTFVWFMLKVIMDFLSYMVFIFTINSWDLNVKWTSWGEHSSLIKGNYLFTFDWILKNSSRFPCFGDWFEKTYGCPIIHFFLLIF